jgi:GTP-binding protein HflX
VLLEKLFTYDKAGEIQLIRKFGQLISEEYTEDGIVVKAYVPSEIYGRII